MTQSDIGGPPDTGSVLVTGPTRGLGRALVDELARRGAPLVLLGRDPAVRRVAAEVDGRAVPVDLADLDATRRAADEVAARVRAGEWPAPTAVVLNAGLQATDRRHRSVDGHELTFAVNVLAQHLLLRRLAPALAPGAHVVLVGSGTHYGDRSMGLVAPPRWEDPADLARPDLGDDADLPVAGQRAYATSKLAVVLLAHGWQRRLGDRARVNVYDPGLMPGTGLARDMGPGRRWVWRHVLPVLRVLPGVTTPTNSARHLADLALGAAHGDLRGAYVAIGRAARSSDASYDRAREDRLLAVADELTAAASTRSAPASGG
jgi:NAD(P)-dependent dehydrogenase (short-subunit alcohol dehydrogenase family)